MGMLLDNEGRHGEAQRFFKKAAEWGTLGITNLVHFLRIMAGEFAESAE